MYEKIENTGKEICKNFQKDNIFCYYLLVFSRWYVAYVLCSNIFGKLVCAEVFRANGHRDQNTKIEI